MSAVDFGRSKRGLADVLSRRLLKKGKYPGGEL